MLYRSTRPHAQRDALSGLGVEVDRIYVDHGLTGTNRERPGLREALAACRAGDTLVVTKLDRLARSLPDVRAIADELTTRQISLSLGGSVYDPHAASHLRGCRSSASGNRSVLRNGSVVGQPHPGIPATPAPVGLLDRQGALSDFGEAALGRTDGIRLGRVPGTSTADA